MLFDKIASVFFIWKNVYILALEMASPENQHCANCIGTLSTSIPISRLNSTQVTQLNCSLVQFVRCEQLEQVSRPRT